MNLRQRLGNFVLFIGVILAFVFVVTLSSDNRYSIVGIFAAAVAVISFGSWLRFGGKPSTKPTTPTPSKPAFTLPNLLAGFSRKNDKDKKH